MRKNPPTNYFFSFENCIGVTRNPRKIRVDYLWVRVSTNDYIVSNEIKPAILGEIMLQSEPKSLTIFLSWMSGILTGAHLWSGHGATMVIIEMQVRGISICSKRPLGRCSIPLCLAKFSSNTRKSKSVIHMIREPVYLLI